MWINNKVFNKIVESNAELIQRVGSLEESRYTMTKQIDTMTKENAGIAYGSPYMTFCEFGLGMPTKATKSLHEVVSSILQYLKIEITDTAEIPAIPAETTLIKIKRKKPKK